MRAPALAVSVASVALAALSSSSDAASVRNEHFRLIAPIEIAPTYPETKTRWSVGMRVPVDSRLSI
jgi:hypothetical protein